VRIATWNVNSLKVRLPRVEGWLAEVQPDIICLQETKVADKSFPALAFATLGYESAHHGQGQWNGVAILSRVGLEDVVADFADGGAKDRDARIISATCAGIRMTSVYVPNGRALDDDGFGIAVSLLVGRPLARSRAPFTVSPSFPYLPRPFLGELPALLELFGLRPAGVDPISVPHQPNP